LGFYTHYGNHFIIVKPQNWKSSGNDQIQNYWLTAFPAAHKHITEIFNVVVEEPEKVQKHTHTHTEASV
jgi:hypothetical protein